MALNRFKKLKTGLSKSASKVEGAIASITGKKTIDQETIDNIEDQVTLYEPHQSLFAEENGLLNYKNIIKNLRKNINKDQIIFFEIGINQSSSVINLLKINNFAVISVENDLANIPRCIVAKRI